MNLKVSNWYTGSKLIEIIIVFTSVLAKDTKEINTDSAIGSTY